MKATFIISGKNRKGEWLYASEFDKAGYTYSVSEAKKFHSVKEAYRFYTLHSEIFYKLTELAVRQVVYKSVMRLKGE